MDSQYHITLTREALGPYFGQPALDEIIAANLAQDGIQNLLGTRSHLHFDNDKFVEARAYVASEHARIIELARAPEDVASVGAQRAALGRLCHTVQDFYAHSNYVDLWLAAKGGSGAVKPGDIDGLDKTLLASPDLRSGFFYLWRDFIYYVPLLKTLARRLYIPPNSHEAMNLDSPACGPKFAYAMVAAQQRTLYEYRLSAEAVLAAGGGTALARLTRG